MKVFVTVRRTSTAYAYITVEAKSLDPEDVEESALAAVSNSDFGSQCYVDAEDVMNFMPAGCVEILDESPL